MPAAASADTWFPAAPLNPPRSASTATLLADGKVLFAGGFSSSETLALAQLFDPPSDTWTNVAPMLVGRSSPAATLLPDGNVLVVGGYEVPKPPQEGPQTAELYDPATNTWTPIPGPPAFRGVESLTLLRSGEVLLLGAFGPQLAGASVGAAIYDPTSATWRSAAAPKQPLLGRASALLPNGRVLFVGGYTIQDTFPPVGTRYTVYNNAEEYDPSTDTWTSLTPMHQLRAGETATMLPDGDVLVAGGVSEIQTADFVHGALASAELYDPQTDAWSAVAPMNLARTEHSATALPSGNVLVAGGGDCGSGVCLGFGGSGDCCAASSAEVYNPTANTWTFTPPVTTGLRHTAILLPSGGVLVTGGSFEPIPMPNLNTAEIYASSYPPDESSAQQPVIAPPSSGPPPGPVISNVKETNRVWREGHALASVARRHRPPLGTRFSFTLNEQARATLIFTRHLIGREVGRMCAPKTGKNLRKRHCERRVTQGGLSFTGHAGPNTVSFEGRVSAGRKLPAGVYTLAITAVNAAGERATSTPLRFTVI
jgi:hypothetical protein